MTAVTESSRRETVWGDSRVIIAVLTNVQNNYTWAGLHGDLEGYWFTPTTEADIGITHSSGTLTFLTSSTLAGVLVAVTKGG